jgi:hypothetical protein
MSLQGAAVVGEALPDDVSCVFEEDSLDGHDAINKSKSGTKVVKGH